MNPSQALATVLVDELVRNGVREVVLCPGSRSAPLAYAALAAERAGRLRLHVRVDERSAGFLALGLARGSGAPVAVMTTSGTAVANLHPAVLEAHHGDTPLVVVSADRPHELRGTGANQTTVQPGIFGSSTRYAVDMPAPVARPGLGPFWRSTVCRAVAAATGAVGGSPGPVHLNVCLREPLAPASDPYAAGPQTAPRLEGDDDWPDALSGRPDGEPWVLVAGTTQGQERPPPWPRSPGPSSSSATSVTPRSVSGPQRGPPSAGIRSSAEPFGTAALRADAVPHGPLLLTATDWLDAHAPERVVVVGRPTLSRAVGGLLRRPGLRVEVVSEGGQWPDPSHVASAVHSPTALRLGGPTAPDDDHGWGESWRVAAQRLADAVAAQPFPWPSGLGVASALVDGLPGDAVLVLGSSNPVRDVDLAVAGPIADEVLANRGLAGIDGVVSTAVGIALARGAGSSASAPLDPGRRPHLRPARRPHLPARRQRPAHRPRRADAGPHPRRRQRRRGRHLHHPRARRPRACRRLRARLRHPHRNRPGALCRAHGIRHDRRRDRQPT